MIDAPPEGPRVIPADDPPGGPVRPAQEKKKTRPGRSGADKRRKAAESGAPPNAGARASVRTEAREIEQKLASLLGRPAFPMRLAGDEWPAEHIESNAPGLASAVARRCEEDARLREQMLRLLRVGDNAGLVMAAVMYLVPVLLYYGVVPAPPVLTAQLGVPNRADVRGVSITEQMRAEAENAERVRAQGERVASAHAQDPASQPENTVGAQAGPVPAGAPPFA
jgi:hypothetical protein